MKLAIYYLNKVGIAGNLQSIVSVTFFVLFVFILYIVFRGSKKEYEDFGDLPLNDKIAKNFDSQEKN